MTGNEENVFMELTGNGDTLQVVPNYYHWKYKLPFQRTIVCNNRKVFHTFQNKLHFKGWYNDTDYTYNEMNRIVPEYFIDLKNFKLPDEMRVEKGAEQTNSSRYFWDFINETLRYIIIKYSSCLNPVEDKELTTGYILYNKDQGSGYDVKCPDSEVPGFQNDFDGGPVLAPLPLSCII